MTMWSSGWTLVHYPRRYWASMYPEDHVAIGKVQLLLHASIPAAIRSDQSILRIQPVALLSKLLLFGAAR